MDYYLCYLTDNNLLDYKRFDFQKIEISTKNSFSKFYKNFIDGCEMFLNSIFNENKLSSENLYKDNIILEEYNKYSGIFLDGCSNLETYIIKRFEYLTSNMPTAKTLLLCNEETSEEEIISFLYRALLCKSKALFCIGRTECLSKEKKNIIMDTIIEIFKDKEPNYDDKKMKCCLLIVNIDLEDE